MSKQDKQLLSEDKVREQQELDELYKPDPDEPWWNR